MKIVFLGSSELSVISLKELIKGGHEILAVVCQPDKPNARGNKIEVSELKKYAISQNIPVYQFQKIGAEGVDILKSLSPELLVVVYYGQILSQEILEIGSKGIINLHPSLLPKYRGPSPVISTVLNGETETGVTIIRVAKDVDAGDIILQEKTAIFENETAGELWERLTKLGSELLIKAIKQIKEGKTKEVEQDHSQATFTKKFHKEDTKIDFSKKVKEIVNQVRAFNPTPVAYFEYKGEKIKVYEAEDSKIPLGIPGEVLRRFAPGTILVASPKEGLLIDCADGFIYLKKLQAPNGKILDVKDFLNGKKFDIKYIIK
jgi:methionyl-tRNA formyltransferase